MAETSGKVDQGGSRAWVMRALDRHERKLILYAYQILGDLERAQDVVQDTFLRLCLQEQEKMEPVLRVWLFTVCRNRALDVIRKESRMTHMAEDVAHPQEVSQNFDPAQVAEKRDHLNCILASVSVLPPREQEILRLKFQQGLSYREIGSVMEVSISHVGVLIHTALRSLRAKLAIPAQGRKRAQGE